MWLFIFSLLLSSGLHQQAKASLVFVNTNATANLQKLEISSDKTSLYTASRGQEKLLASWNQVPANYDNDGIRSRYKMIVESEDASAKRIFEISYIINRQTTASTAYIKSTFIYKDNRGRQTAEDYFKLFK